MVTRDDGCISGSAPFGSECNPPPLDIFDLSFDSPAMNLAFDEVLLDACEEDSGKEYLRFWESPSPFVVLGVAQVLRDEVDEARCREEAVPILRRCSAGGAVVQGPGCLNYSIVLRYDRHPVASSLRASYCYILGAIASAFASRGVGVQIRGTSDLAIGDRKVSGNAQKRRRRAFLHHGTLLYGMTSGAMHRYLREPQQRPVYRETRTHDEFVTTLDMDPGALRSVVLAALRCEGAAAVAPVAFLDRTSELVTGKYLTSAWIYRR